MSTPTDIATEADNALPAATLEDLMDSFDGGGSPAEPTEPKTEPVTPAPDPATQTPDDPLKDFQKPTEEVKTEPEAQPVKEVDEKGPSIPKGDGEDEFDKETQAKLDEMKYDPHPGIKYAELRKELKELKAAKAALEADGANTEEMQRLRLQAEAAETFKTEAEKLKADLSLLDYKATTEFDNLVNKPLNEIGVLANSIEEANGIDLGTIARAIQNSDQATQTSLIEGIVDDAGLSARDQARIYRMADDYLKIAVTDSSLRDTAQNRMKELSEMQVSQQTAAEEKQAQELRAGVNDAFSRYEGRIPGFVTDDGKPTEEYRTLQAQAASTSIDNVGDESFSIMAATLLPKVLSENKRMAEELSNKNKMLSRYGGATPSATPAAAAPASTKKAPTSFMDALEQADF